MKNSNVVHLAKTLIPSLQLALICADSAKQYLDINQTASQMLNALRCVQNDADCLADLREQAQQLYWELRPIQQISFEGYENRCPQSEIGGGQ